MKTIGTVINTLIIVGGMVAAFVTGSIFGYSIVKSENKSRPYTYYWPNYNPYKNYKKEEKEDEEN